MNNLYYTQSLNLAAYIMSKGIEPIGKTKLQKGMTIYFNKTKELHEIVDDYNSNLEIKKFIASFKDLKQYLNK